MLMTPAQDLRTVTTWMGSVDFELREIVTSMVDTTHLLDPGGSGRTACGKRPDIEPDDTEYPQSRVPVDLGAFAVAT